MEHASSAYQSFKLLLAEYLPIDRDILHIVIGLALILIALLVARRTARFLPFVVAFWIACLLGVGMELLDRRDDLKTFGHWRWQASLADFVRTVSFPFIGLVIAFFVKRSRRG